MKEVYAFLKKCETYYIATMDGDQPRVRPFGTIDFFENKLYIQTGKIKAVSKQLHANPKVEICGIVNGKWIRIEAIAVEDDRVEAREHMLAAYPSLKAMYAADDGNTEVFYLKDMKATLYAFGEEPQVIELR
nr:pyridoxamine 5'-phosphate oxidase family protein [uncultured Cellulosilyticum sp.]